MKPLERRLLQALVERSEERLADRLRGQVELLAVHGRLHFEKSMALDLYPGDEYRAAMQADDVLFPNRTDFRLATLSFEVRGEKFKAEFGASGGRLFDIVVRPNPRRALGATEIRVTRFRRGGDAFEEAVPIRQQHFETVPPLVGLLGEWAERFGVDDVNRPLDAGWPSACSRVSTQRYLQTISS